jgi:hypothetical protein
MGGAIWVVLSILSVIPVSLAHSSQQHEPIVVYF